MKWKPLYREIDQKISELQHLKKTLHSVEGLLLGTGKSSANTSSRKGMRRTLSAAARKRIAAAQRARWAVWHKQKNRS